MRRVWIVVKLVLLYLQYFLVGLVEESFQIQKGNYLCDLDMFPAAAKAYERALRETQAPLVLAALGYCYLCMDLPDKAVKYLQQAYGRRAMPDIGVTLLHALHQNGDTAQSRELYQILKNQIQRLSEEGQAGLAKYEELMIGLDDQGTRSERGARRGASPTIGGGISK